MAEFMKATFSTTKRMGMGASSIQMGTCTLANSDRIKNMGKDLSTGSVSALPRAQRSQSIILSNTMACGGAGCQMERDNTKRSMVFLM